MRDFGMIKIFVGFQCISSIPEIERRDAKTQSFI